MFQDKGFFLHFDGTRDAGAVLQKGLSHVNDGRAPRDNQYTRARKRDQDTRARHNRFFAKAEKSYRMTSTNGVVQMIYIQERAADILDDDSPDTDFMVAMMHSHSIPVTLRRQPSSSSGNSRTGTSEIRPAPPRRTSCVKDDEAEIGADTSIHAPSDISASASSSSSSPTGRTSPFLRRFGVLLRRHSRSMKLPVWKKR